MDPKRPLGLAILIGVIVVVALVLWMRDDPDPNPGDLVTVNGFGGGLKASFFNDPQIADILEDRYGMVVEIDVIPSITMLNKACDGTLKETDDFLWAGDQSTVEIYRGCGGAMVASDDVYNSPLVVYSWTDIVDGLVATGYAQLQPNGAYTLDIAKLIDAIRRGETWGSLGLAGYHGEIMVHTSDPSQSNSGFQFAGLLANMLNGGRVVTMATVDPLLPDIQAFFQRLGFMWPTSAALFEQFMQTGRGSKPMIVCYESQIFEFLVQNPQYQAQIQQEVRLLYPQPTIWASHPLIARTAEGKQLLDALMDPEIQQLAWEHHGQRPGVPGISIDTAATGIPGILKQITSVINMPASDVMQKIREVIAAAPNVTLPATPGAVVTPMPVATSSPRRRATGARSSRQRPGRQGPSAGRAWRCRSEGRSRLRRPGGRR